MSRGNKSNPAGIGQGLRAYMHDSGLLPQPQVAPQPPRYDPQQPATDMAYAAVASSGWVQLPPRPCVDDPMPEGGDYDHDSYTLPAAAGAVPGPAAASGPAAYAPAAAVGDPRRR